MLDFCAKSYSSHTAGVDFYQKGKLDEKSHAITVYHSSPRVFAWPPV